MAETQAQWIKDRKFISVCRVCHCWKVQNKHWVPIEAEGPTGTESTSGYWEECRPSDNLEYLEGCLDQDE